MITDNSIKDAPFYFDRKVWIIPFLLLIMIWSVYGYEFINDYNFNEYGIYPRTLKGLRGIIFSPFLHGSAQHLLSNSLPLFALTAALIYFYRNIALRVLLLGALLSGFLTWLIAREAYHIGASTEIYLLASFIFFSGIFRKSLRLVAISLAVAFWYGGMIWYVLPIVDGMSWEGHLSGLITGLCFAYWFKNNGLKKQEFQFTPSEIDNFIDEDGNFIPPPERDEIEELR